MRGYGKWISIVALVVVVLVGASSVFATTNDSSTGCVASNPIGPGQRVKLDFAADPNPWAGVIYVNIPKTSSTKTPAFCTDLKTSIKAGDCFQLDNSNPLTSCPITWLLNNGYGPDPAESNAENAARQAAVWHFSDGANVLPVDPVYARTQEIISQVPASCALPTEPPVMTIDPPSAINLLPNSTTHQFTVTVTLDGQPVEGQTVDLSTTFGTLSTNTVTTNANGQAVFSISSALPGTAQITASFSYTLPGGSRFTKLPGTPDQQVIVLGSPRTGKVVATASKTWEEGNTVIVHKFYDQNINGVQDSNEENLSGWVMTLQKYDPATQLWHDQGSLTTDSNGNAAFNGLVSGTYRVRETEQTGWQVTTPNPSDSVELNSGGQAVIEFGNVALAVIRAHKFNDLNGNGQKDANEPLLDGWTINISPAVNGIGSGETVNGAVSFVDLYPNTYTVWETQQSGWCATTAMTRTVTVGNLDFKEVWFGNRLCPATPTPTSTPTSTPTDTPTATPTWTPTATPTDTPTSTPTWTPTSTPQQLPAVAVDKSVPPQSNVRNGIVLVGNTVNFQVVVTNSGPTTLAYIPLHDQFDNTCLRYAPKSANPQENDHSDDSIDWLDLTVSFAHDLQPGQAFTLTIPFQTAAEDNNAVNTAVVQNAKDVNSQVAPDAQDQASVICKMPASIGDYVWNDANGNGLQDDGANHGINGVTVRLYQDDGDGVFEPGTDDTLVATQTTAGDGAYDFTMLYAGSYWVDVDETSPALSGYTFISGSQSGPEPKLVTVNYGDAYQDADFGYAGKGNLAGTVWYDWNSDGSQEPGEDGIPNVTVDLYHDTNCDGVKDGSVISTTTTASDGSYIFYNQLPGCYVVEETNPSGYSSTTPDDKPVTLVVEGPSGSAVDNDFGDVNYAKVGDFTYEDQNGNGVEDSSETNPVVNVPLHLVGIDVTGAAVDKSTVSDSNGAYLFDLLVPGTYTVTATAPAGYVITSPNPRTVTVSAGEERLDVDFGLIAPTAVQIVALRAHAEGHAVTVNWQTVAEDGVEQFVVQRYAQGGWLNVGTVPAVGIGGNSYRFTEKKVSSGRHLYRIVSQPTGTAFGPVEVKVGDPWWQTPRLFMPFVDG